MYQLFSRKDKATARDVFARESSIINERNRKLLIADICRFDIIKSNNLFNLGWL